MRGSDCEVRSRALSYNRTVYQLSQSTCDASDAREQRRRRQRRRTAPRRLRLRPRRDDDILASSEKETDGAVTGRGAVWGAAMVVRQLTTGTARLFIY